MGFLTSIRGCVEVKFHYCPPIVAASMDRSNVGIDLAVLQTVIEAPQTIRVNHAHVVVGAREGVVAHNREMCIRSDVFENDAGVASDLTEELVNVWLRDILTVCLRVFELEVGLPTVTAIFASTKRLLLLANSCCRPSGQLEQTQSDSR